MPLTSLAWCSVSPLECSRLCCRRDPLASSLASFPGDGSLAPFSGVDASWEGWRMKDRSFMFGLASLSRVLRSSVGEAVGESCSPMLSPARDVSPRSVGLMGKRMFAIAASRFSDCLGHASRTMERSCAL